MKPTLMRRVRIIVNDPYATDDSSSDELPKPPTVKRIVHEISLPFHAATTPSLNKPRNLPVGVRLRKSGRYSAVVRHPITRTRKWLGTYKSCEEATKAIADKKLEYDALALPSSILTANTHCLHSPYAAPVHFSKQKMSLDKHVVASGDSTINFDFSDLQIPDLSFLAADEESMLSDPNALDLNFDSFLMDNDTDHLLDDLSLFGNDINICGFDNSVPSELPDCNFTDVELELSDLKPCSLSYSSKSQFY